MKTIEPISGTTDLEKIIIAANTITLMAAQLHMVTVLKKVTNNAGSVGLDEDALEACVKALSDVMEELGNYTDNGESFNEETLGLVNEAFDMVNDRGSTRTANEEEIDRLRKALQFIAGLEDESRGALDEVQGIAQDALEGASLDRPSKP